MNRPICTCGRKASTQGLCRSCYDAARYERNRTELSARQREYHRRNRDRSATNHRQTAALLNGWRGS